MSAPNETSEQLQRWGQRSYRNKDFQLGLLLFTQALETPGISPELQLHVLDNRAAVQEKIGGAVSLRNALADAKKMIKLEKTCALGYLRAGKILQLQGSDKIALDIYELGLKRTAPNDDDSRKRLQKMHQKVFARIQGLQATRCLDMMSILPLELVEIVLRNLPFHSLMLAQGVSRTWRQFLITRYHTYNTVDYSAAKRPVSNYAFKSCVKRSKGNIAKLVLGQSGVSDGQLLVYLASRCKDLSSVEVMGFTFASSSIVEMARVAENLKSLVLSCLTTMSAITEVITQCEMLESLECRNIIVDAPALWSPERPKILRRLLLVSANDSSIFTYLRLPKLLEQLPRLRELELTGWVGNHPRLDFSPVRELEVLKLAEMSTLEEFPILPPTIRRLDLSGNPRLVYRLEHIIASPLRDLESLSVGSNPKINNGMVLALLEPSLEHHRPRILKMDRCPQLNFDSLDWLLGIGYGQMLVDLNVAGNSTFGDQVSKELGSLKILKRLDISNTMISGIGILNLVNRSGNAIQWMCLDGCEYVGYDAVQKVRDMGIFVSHRLTGDLRGGKAVRYRD